MKHEYVNFIQSSQPTSYIHPILNLTTQNKNDHAFYTTALGNWNLHKTIAKHHFSLMIFASTQVLMDIAPLLGIVYGWQYLHLYTHHLVGALLIGSISPLIIKPISKWFLRLFKYQLQNFMANCIFQCTHWKFQSHFIRCICPYRYVSILPIEPTQYALSLHRIPTIILELYFYAHN